MAGLAVLLLVFCAGVAVAPKETARIGLLGLWILAGASMFWGIGSALAR